MQSQRDSGRSAANGRLACVAASALARTHTEHARAEALGYVVTRLELWRVAHALCSAVCKPKEQD